MGNPCIVIYNLANTSARINVKEAERHTHYLAHGFFTQIRFNPKSCKIIDDNAGVTHSFLAHQLPDLAATFLVPLVAAILIFVFDWILGLACIVPVIIAMLVMGFMMNAEGRQFMKKNNIRNRSKKKRAYISISSLHPIQSGACAPLIYD